MKDLGPRLSGQGFGVRAGSGLRVRVLGLRPLGSGISVRVFGSQGIEVVGC